MKKSFFTVLMFLCLALTLSAQGSLKGTVMDDEGEAVIGAAVVLDGTKMGTVTEYDGTFAFGNIDPGTYTLKISYVGFSDISQEVNISSGETDLGTMTMELSSIGLNEVEVVASVAIDRKTPVAVSTLDGEEISELVGNQEYPEVLRKTPSIYVTKQGGGFGDSRINVRGFDQRNTAVMINGVPVNDMENGWVYWSNWAGLSDVTSKMQVQRGLGASKLAVASVGGSINIITNAAEMDKGIGVSMSFGNDMYQKYGVVLSSGLMDNGWAITAQATHTRGDGYVDGTQFRAYSYFLSLSKTFNKKHTIAFTGLGAPQWHNQRNAAGRFDNINLQTFEDRGIRFNHLWGNLNGEEFSFRKNFYHKPKFFINHYWNVSDRTDIKTSAYVSVGRGGGTGPRGRIDNDNAGRIFDSFSGFGEGIHDENGQIRWDDIVAYNQGQNVDDFGGVKATDGDFNNLYTTTRSGDGFIRRASMNEHNWTGILSTITHEVNDNWDLVTGIDGRYYVGKHYRRVEDLLGNDAYLSTSDVNNSNNYITDEGRADGNVIAYNNDGIVAWGGGFAQVEFNKNNISWFAALTGSQQSFKRIDYFAYDSNDETRETPWVTSYGGTIKTGVNYNFGINNVFFNAGVTSRQPIFDDVFVGFTNDVEYGVRNQKIYATELGYGLRHKFVNANLNLYYTKWTNRRISQGLDVTLPDGTEVEGRAIFTGVAQRHMGIELEAEVRPIKYVSLDLMLSVGDWEYADNFDATIFDEDQNEIGDATIYGKDIKVGDAAQTTLNVGLNIYPVKGLKIYADYYFADNLYADFNIDESQFLSPGAQVAKLPSYSLVDMGFSYRLPIKAVDITAIFNMNNVLDTKYISELETNIVDDANTEENEFMNNRGFYGFGRTWNLGLKFRL